MFEAAVSGFVKAVGKDSLLPVPDLNSANKCRPLHIAVKKNPKWFWQSAKYLPTSFKVKEDGGIDLMYTREGSGGFAAKAGAGVVHTDAPPNTELGHTMKPLLSMEEQKRNSVTSAVLKVMEVPADLPVVEELLDDVVDGRKPKPFAEFKSACSNPMAVLAFLSAIDFQMDTPFTDEDKALIRSLDALFDGLLELSDEQCLALKECNSNFAPAILHVLAQGIAGHPVPLDDPAISILYVKSNNPGQDFLEALDFGIQDVGNKKSLVTEDDGKRLYAAQQAVYGLWGGL
uniref:GSDMES6 n=1 Tax=Branchiostoma belcheri TaxID=7741 RepID=A0A9E9AU43_BRABE|nr:GSDMES6 [Branchiostoma belcheri]